MDAFLQLPADQRRNAFAETEARLGLNRTSVEKDLWVCWTLRELFQLPDNWSWMDYSTLRPGALRLVPLADQIQEWRRDYDSMRQEMFFGEVPAFDEMIRVVGEFERQFNQRSPTS